MGELAIMSENFDIRLESLSNNIESMGEIGKPVMTLDKIAIDVRKKIQDYVPKNVEWV